MYRFSTYKRQYKANLKLALPVVMTQLGQILVQVADNVMVGRYGGDDPTPLAATSFGGSVFFILFIAAIGIVSSSTWLLHGILVGLYTAFSIQIAQYLGADRQQDARGVLRQSMLFNLLLGLGAAAFGIGISRFLPG